MEDRQKAAEDAMFDQTNLLAKEELLVVFGALAVSLFICFVDQNGIGVALPTIGKELHAEATISWAGTSALIANTIFQVLYGRMSDLFGKSDLFLFQPIYLISIDRTKDGLSIGISTPDHKRLAMRPVAKRHNALRVSWTGRSS